MKKAIGVIGTTVLLCAMSVSNPALEVKAAPGVVETIELPEQLLTYDDFCQLYTCKEVSSKGNSKIIEMDQTEAQMIMKIGQIEAGETDPMAIAYVMKAIVNRRDDPYFPDTISGVLSQEGQFTTIKTSKYQKATPNVNAHYALYLLESGQVSIESEYFEATWVTNSWMSNNTDLEVEFEYGGHRFYKKKTK